MKTRAIHADESSNILFSTRVHKVGPIALFGAIFFRYISRF
jgi:hypothetical protein